MTYASEVLADSPLIYWRLGETSGTTTVDSSGNGRNGTLTGTYTQGVTGLLTGDADKAITFTAGLSTAADTADLTAFSIEVWVKTTDGSSTIVGREHSTGANRIFRLHTNGGAADFQVHKNSSTIAQVVGPTVNDNVVHHIVGTYDGTTCRLYVDGVEVGTPSTVVSGALPTANTNFTAGGGHTFATYAGTLDEVAYYATALSSGRIAAHYAAGTSAAANEVVIDADLPTIVGSLTLDLESPREISFDADLPGIVGSLLLSPSRTAYIDAEIPTIVGGLTLDNLDVTAVRIDATMPGVTSEVALRAIAVESERNRAGAWTRNNIGEATWFPAVVAPPVTIPPAMDVVAQAYTAPTINGTRALVEPTYLREPGHRDRIIIAGRDITYWRGVPTPTPDFQRIQPLLHGTATIELPQAVIPFETPGQGDLSWLVPGAAVVVQRVDAETGEIIKANDYVGLVVAFDLSGSSLRIECGGHGSGRAAMIDRQMQLIQVRGDAGLIAAQAIQALRLRHDPPLGPVTGINLIRWGGGNMLDYINELMSKMTTTGGDQWTLMPDENLTYRTTLRDLDTIHGTAYLDDARVKGELRRDISEEPNRVFASAVDPNGKVIKFGAYPGLIQGPAAPYPMDDNTAFGIGTTDADTDTGDGITIMGYQLVTSGFLPGRGFYAFDVEASEAIKDLQRAAGLAPSGTMTPGTWRALWNLSITGHDLRHIRILPAAEDPEVKPWRLSANGSLIARNPEYDPSVPWVDRTIAMGAGFTKPQVRQWSRTELATEAVWRGTITITTGAIVAGEHTPGDPITAILRARDIEPGMNISLPLFAGGIVVHVAGVSFTDGGRTAMLAVSTRPGDTLPVWAAIQRDRDNRNTVHRSFNAQRKASNLQRENTFDEVGGVISPLRLNGGDWTVFPVVAKQAGTIERIRMVVEPEREFVVAVFGRRISPGRLRRVTNAPLTVPGRKRWTEENVYDKLDRDHVVLYVAGSDEDPCGYFPGRKSEGNTLNGRWDDEASFSFVTYANDTDRGSVLWVAVWVPNSTTLQGGRIMWPSAEDY